MFLLHLLGSGILTRCLHHLRGEAAAVTGAGEAVSPLDGVSAFKSNALCSSAVENGALCSCQMWNLASEDLTLRPTSVTLCCVALDK